MGFEECRGVRAKREFAAHALARCVCLLVHAEAAARTHAREHTALGSRAGSRSGGRVRVRVRVRVCACVCEGKGRRGSGGEQGRRVRGEGGQGRARRSLPLAEHCRAVPSVLQGHEGGGAARKNQNHHKIRITGKSKKHMHADILISYAPRDAEKRSTFWSKGRGPPG